MARTLSIVLSLASLLGLALAPSAVAAIGLSGQRAVAKPQRSAAANRSATASPLMAPAAVCPGQEDLEASAEAQQQTMRCMTEYARSQIGLAALAETEALDASARGKALDILRCDSFSHFACGRAFTFWMKETGYIGETCWRAGENLAWGTGEQGSVRSIFQAWMRSPSHRQNILGNYAELGVSLSVGNLAGQSGTRIWAQHFGSRCDG